MANDMWRVASRLFIGVAVLLAGCAAPARVIVVTATPAPSESSRPAALPAAPGRLDLLLEETFVALYERASPSVVHITARTQVFDFFRGVIPNEGTGSGFFYDEEGHIITNNHVVEGASAIEVILADGTRAPARVVGTDAYSDLAVLRAEGLAREQIKPLPLGTNRDLKVGMLVIAIGNPFGLDRTMTTGIISALGRTLEREDQAALGEVIQTDAAINPGNSGGPLLNLRGEVIGVNTAIQSPSGGSVGIGFAVPADTVARIVPELIAKGRYDHPWLGITAYEITLELAQLLSLPTDRGLLIAQVQRGATADLAGVRGATQRVLVRGGYLLVGGDILTAVDERPIATRDQLTIYLENNKRVGEPVALSIIRDGQPLTLTAQLTARP